jgi:hypothetical protein
MSSGQSDTPAGGLHSCAPSNPGERRWGAALVDFRDGRSRPLPSSPAGHVQPYGIRRRGAACKSFFGPSSSPTATSRYAERLAGLMAGKFGHGPKPAPMLAIRRTPSRQSNCPVASNGVRICLQNPAFHRHAGRHGMRIHRQCLAVEAPCWDGTMASLNHRSLESSASSNEAFRAPKKRRLCGSAHGQVRAARRRGHPPGFA